MLDFNWASITLIDIGVLSISIIGLWWLARRHNALQQNYETLQQEHKTLQQEHKTLQQEHKTLQQEHKTLQQVYETLQLEFRAFQSAADRRYSAAQLHWEEQYKTLQLEWEERYNPLKEEYDTLKAESEILKTGLETITQEHKLLERTCDTMAGRYQEISDKFTLILETLAAGN